MNYEESVVEVKQFSFEGEHRTEVPLLLPKEPLKVRKDTFDMLSLDYAGLFDAQKKLFYQDDEVKSTLCSTVPDHISKLWLDNKSRNMTTRSIARLDVVISQGQPWIAEIDFVPGGRGITAGYEKLFFGESRFVNAYQDFISSVLSDVRDKKVFYLIPQRLQGYDKDCSFFVKECRREGIDIKFGTLEDHLRKPSRDRKGIVDRFYLKHELDEETASPLWGLKRKEFLSSRISFLDCKAWFAFLHDPKYRWFWIDELGRDEFERFLRVIPHTFLLAKDNAGIIAAYPGAIRKHLVVKCGAPEQKEMWGAVSVNIGNDYTNVGWKTSIRTLAGLYKEGISRTWRGGCFKLPIVQEFHRSDIFQVPAIQSNGSSAGIHCSFEGKIRISPFIFVVNDSCFMTPGISTLRPSNIVHGASDCLMTPNEII